MTLVLAVARWGVAAAVAGALVWASSSPMAVRSTDAAVLRIAWSARPERIQHCRPAAETAVKLPASMQPPPVCDETPAHYRLRVIERGRVLIDREVSGGGLRGDRRLYVFHEFDLPPGDARIQVSMRRVEHVAAAATSHRPFADVPPPVLELDEVRRLEAGRAVLVTFDPGTRALVARAR